MRELDTNLNKKVYYISMPFLFLLMIMGLVIDNPRMSEFDYGYILHIILVVLLIVILSLYPKYETAKMRVMIIVGVFIYFYSLFLLYPETFSTFLLICLIPALSIFFFDSRLFYFSLFMNGILVSFIFIYFGFFINEGNHEAYYYFDLTGNLINFLASQLTIFLIFYLTYERMKKIKLYYEQIRHSEQMRATGQLAAAVAHEIRNPLTVVKGFLQLYEKNSSFNEQQKNNFHLMVTELNAAEKVISQYLSLAKPNDSGKVETVDIKEVLQSVTDLLRSYGVLRNNRIDLNIHEPIYISANKFEMKQLFTNVIKNAIEVSEIGAAVLVSAENTERVVEIKVTDFGIGMTESEINSLGTPFYTLKSKGTGLGLMICFNIVEKNNGTIHFDSKKGEGTTVTMTFPAVKRKGDTN